MADLHRRLDELVVAARNAASPPAAPLPGVPPRLDELIGGCERSCGNTAFWHVETFFEQACRRQNLPHSALQTGALAVACDGLTGALDPRRTIILDIETGGFAGTPVFLIGVVPLDVRPLRIVQFLARDYPEEEAIVRALAALARQRDMWVSFNGKSFDEPFLRDRAAVYRVPLPAPGVHVDLLHEARRRWRAEVPNCKLQTLERHVLGWQRLGDVPGSEIPDLFHHFIRTGNPAPLRPVIEHNQLDLICCAELLHRLA